MPLPQINREAVGRVLGHVPAIRALAAADSISEPSTDLLHFINILDETGFVTPFDWNAEFGSRLDDLTDEKIMQNADLETLRKIFTAQIRVNRFRQGFLEELIRQGKWSIMLNRLQWLYDNNRL